MTPETPPEPREAHVYKRGQFAMVPVWIIRRCCPDHFAALAVFNYIAGRYGHQNREFFPSQKRLAKELGISLATVSRAVKVLRQMGAIVTSVRRKDDGTPMSLNYQLETNEPDGGGVIVSDDNLADEGLIVSDDKYPTSPETSTLKDEPDVLNQIKYKRSEKENKTSDPNALPGLDRTYPSKSQRVTRHANGQLGSPKRRRDNHTLYAFECAYFRVKAEKHEEYVQWVIRAGGPAETVQEDLLEFYRDCESALDRGEGQTAEHVNFWLAKELSARLKESFGVAS